jgi:hypothetical protein
MPALHAADDRVATLMHAYLAAEYRWERDGHWHDVVVGLPTPGLELAYPDATSFGILSAWNPHSIEREERINRLEDEALQDDLSRSGARYLPAFASAPNRTWKEPSWLVFGLEASAFDAVARRYSQLGTLWWRPMEPVRLRMYAARPAGIADEPYVDWIE